MSRPLSSLHLLNLWHETLLEQKSKKWNNYANRNALSPALACACLRLSFKFIRCRYDAQKIWWQRNKHLLSPSSHLSNAQTSPHLPSVGAKLQTKRSQWWVFGRCKRRNEYMLSHAVFIFWTSKIRISKYTNIHVTHVYTFKHVKSFTSIDA